MSHYQVEVSAVVDAPAERVYDVLADYESGHPSILPQPYFTDLQVIEGGRGAGTVIAVEMEVFGVKRAYKMKVTEPQPGRVLQEEDKEAGILTTFTVEPVAEKQSRVTIKTITQTSPGLRGWLEKMTTPPISRRIYREELEKLATVVAG